MNIEDIFGKTTGEITFLRNLFQHNVFTQQKRLVIQGPKGKAKTFVFGGIQQLRGQNFAIF